MKIAFRVDSSIEIGIGNVMRFLTLANTLKTLTAKCSFVSCQLTENIINKAEKRGHKFFILPKGLEKIKKILNQFILGGLAKN